MIISDIAAILEIQQECRLSGWSAHSYEQEIALNDSVLLVAQVDGETAGFLAARLILPEAEILNFGILDRYRKQGIGSGLFDKLLTIARTKRAESMWLEVRASNRNALRFYENKGFTEIQKRKNFYISPVEDAVIMKLDMSERSKKSPR